MRIISGKFKSRIIQYPKSKRTRPVTDRSKETIFNVLGSWVEGVEVLDLFSGSGSLGLEALSRGAQNAFFIDNDQTACRVIHQNLQTLGLLERGAIFRVSAERAIKNLVKKGKKVKLVFLDPPYNKGLIKKVLNLLDHFDIVKPLGKIVVGRSRHEPLPEQLNSFLLEKEIQIGQSYISFLYRPEQR